MINTSYIIFKCNLNLLDQDHVDEYYLAVHGLEGGAAVFTQLEEMEVDTKIPFTVPDLQTIEKLGPVKRIQVFTSFYKQSVPRGVITKTTNRNESSLKESRSKEFMTELARSSSPKYFGCFKMHLKQAVEDEDIEESFHCKWKDIEAALYKAIGKEQNITRLYNFMDKNASQFHSAPLELLIDQVENHINSVLGKQTTTHTDSKNRTLSDFTFTLKQKYMLIIGIVRPLGGEFKQMKEYIQQVIADKFADITTLIDIQDFQTLLVTQFKT